MLTFIKISTGGDNQDHVSRPGTATKSVKVSTSIKKFENQRGSFAENNHPVSTSRGPNDPGVMQNEQFAFSLRTAEKISKISTVNVPEN